MLLDKKVFTQKRFSSLHRYVSLIILLYLLEQAAVKGWNNCAWVCIVVFSVVSLDLYLNTKSFYSNIRVMVGLRFTQLLVSAIFIVCTSSAQNFALSLLCFVLFLFEFFLLFNFERLKEQVCSLLSVVILVALILVVGGICKDMTQDQVVLLVTLFALSILCAFKKCTDFSVVVSSLGLEVTAQSKLISQLNKANEELTINQEKIKSANDLLASQKVQLEQAYKEINSVNSEMMIQNEIVKYISSSLDIEKLMVLITESVLEGLGLDVCILVLNKTKDNELNYKVRTKYGINNEEKFASYIKEGYYNNYIIGTKTFIDDSADMEKYCLPTNCKKGSVLMVPLVKKEEQIGLLIVSHTTEGYFASNAGFFEGIVAQFLIAIDNANLYARMQRMATHDGLTGIYNRAHLTSCFNEMLNAAILNKTSLTVVLFDIDKFKKVNDSYGHLFGDMVIKMIASLAKEAAYAAKGIVGRYGGEEFVIVFPEMTITEAYPIVQQLHKNIREKEMYHNGELIYVNTSIGITSYPETCKNPSELLNRADWAMYYSKQNGRGKITIDSDEIIESVLLK